jgi:outer membrane protein TolC/ABC-type uncharacterized transport system substrate-binding protein
MLIRKPILLLLLLGLLSAASSSSARAQDPEPAEINIAIVVDGPWARNDEIRDLTRTEILALTEGEFDVRFPDAYYLTGDWSVEGAISNLQTLLEDPNVDLVIGWGVLSSHSICCLVGVTKPVIAPAILDIRLQGVPYQDGVSGVENLSYVALPDTTADEIVRFREIFPFDKIALLANAAIVEAIPDLETRTELALGGLGIEFYYVPVGFEAEPVLAAIPEGTQAIFMYPQIQLSLQEHLRLIQGINERGLLSFTSLGEGFVEAGLLASLAAADFFPRIARRIAINTQRILLGEDAGSIPVEISLKEELTINMRTARALGVSPTYEALLEARVLHPEAADVVQSHTLSEVVNDAVRVNLDLLARERRVLAGEQDVKRAGSVFFPQIDLGALGLVIDEDRAVASFGSQAEQSITGSAGLTQLLFSDDALANKSIQTRLQEGRTSDYEALRLDIALEAGVTYLNLLRAKSLSDVQRNNVALTRSNKELADVRRRIGAANPAEVFRWQSQLAADRKALVEADASVRVAEIAVNRILNRPLTERFSTEEVDQEQPWRVTGDPRIAGFIETPARFETFQDFMVFEGVAAAPELKILRSQIEIQERLLLNSRRAYWAPLIAAEATVDEILSKSGAGAEVPILPGGALFPTPDDSLWSVGLNATLPLFTGGARKAGRLQAELELARFQFAFDSTAFRVEQRIRSGMELARASRSGIGLSQQAADAASKNLDLVTEAYARGAVSIIDLLDAQNAALNAAEQAANSVYDFLIDLLEVERAANRIELLGTPETAAAFFKRLEKYFLDRGITP